MAMSRLFKSHMKMTCFCTSGGRVGRFIDGRFLTEIAEFINYLENEIKNGNPHFYIDEDELEADPKLEDPTERLRAQIRNEILAEMRATNPNNDLGTYDPGKLKPQGSTDVAAVSQGGSGLAVSQRMQELLKQAKANDTNGTDK